MSAMKTFHLEILTPERPFYVGDCLSIVIPVTDGMLGIMAGHTPLTAAIHDGCVTYTLPDGRKVSCAVSRGMLRVGREGAKLLCDSAVLPENVDEEKERAEIEEAMTVLKEQQSHAEYVTAQPTLARAFNNLKVKKDSAE